MYRPHLVPFVAVCMGLSACKTIDKNSESDLANGDQYTEVYQQSEKKLFNGKIHEVELHIKDKNFTRLVETCSDRTAPYRHVAEFRLNQDVVIPNVAIKIRGNTSRCNEKKQFKIDFRKTKKVYETTRNGSAPMAYSDEDKARIKEQRLFGLEGISLRASANDDTMLNELISSQIFSGIHGLNPTFENGGNTYRVSLAKLYVSFQGSDQRDYKGLYMLTENIDEVFLKHRLGKKTGTLVKARYNSEGKVDFSPSSYNPAVYDIKTYKGKDVDQGEEDFLKAEASVKELIVKLNEADSPEALEEFLDISSVLNYALGVHLSGHWDSLWSNFNNDHLVYNEETKKWGIIVWDLDNSLATNSQAGGALLGYDIQHDSPLKMPKNPNLLFAKVFAHDVFVSKYINLAKKVKDDFYGSDQFNKQIVDLRNLIRSSIPDWEREIFSREKYERIFYFKNARLKALGEL